MLTPREFDQIQIAVFAMAKTKLNGRPVVDSDHVLALLKSYCQGDLEVVKNEDDSLSIGLHPKEQC